MNEAPAVLRHKGRLFVLYSASLCWTADYTLGLLEFKVQGRGGRKGGWGLQQRPHPYPPRGAGARCVGTGAFRRLPTHREVRFPAHSDSSACCACSAHSRGSCSPMGRAEAAGGSCAAQRR